MVRNLLIFILLNTFNANGQSIDFYCNGQRHSYTFGAWYDDVQKCKGYTFYSLPTYKSNIASTDSTIIESIKQIIKVRSGDELYKKLELCSISIASDTSKCNIKYAFRYIFRIDSEFYHRFSLTFDSLGNLKSPHQFPDISKNEGSLNIIDYCNAINIAISNSEFKDACDKSRLIRSTPNKKTGEMETLLNISKINLSYNQTLNTWTWEVYSETSVPKKNHKKHHSSGNWTGKKITINAQTSNVINIENFNESKIVCY